MALKQFIITAGVEGALVVLHFEVPRDDGLLHLRVAQEERAAVVPARVPPCHYDPHHVARRQMDLNWPAYSTPL